MGVDVAPPSSPVTKRLRASQPTTLLSSRPPVSSSPATTLWFKLMAATSGQAKSLSRLHQDQPEVHNMPFP